MPFHQPDSVRYYTFDLFDSSAVNHGVITRRGGVSPTPWSALNVGGTVGDDPQRVKENRQRSLHTLGRTLDSIYDVYQVHSAEVVCSDAPRPPDQVHLRADAILTDNPAVTLFMRFADCVPILLHDPIHKVVGLVHAGWMGTVRRTVLAGVQAMQVKYGSQPGDILAGIGPSICVAHYEIGEEVAEQVRQVFGEDAGALLPTTNGSIHLDLWEANRWLLWSAGVREIQISGVCTACHVEDWYSHRAEHGRTGRFGALINLK